MTQWQHKVLATGSPPSQAQLQDMGSQGYEVIAIIYSEQVGQWLTYLKKQLRNPLDDIPF